MASSLQALILTEHPTPFFSIAELALAFLALGPLPTFGPLIVLLAVLRIHGQRIAYRHTRLRELCCSWISVTVGSSFAYWAAATSALSSPTQSLTAIALLSSITYAVVLLPLYFDIRFQARLSNDWSRLMLFPALWAISWSIIGHVSPVGRLLNWAPVSGTHPYSWIMPLTGPVGIDWIVAAWAVVCSEFIAQWLMGFSDPEPLGAQNNRSLLSPRSKALLSLVAILLSLTLPSLGSDLLLRVDNITHATPLAVGCVLPHPSDGSRPTLGDFISEMAKMNSANVLLWPESAVVFNSPKEREAAFAQIRHRNLSALIGVAFEEYVVGDPAHTRNGFALVHMNQKPGEEVIQYYKRNLVPFTESFSKIPSIDPPTITDWPLSKPKGTTAPDWAPAPNYTRPLFITSSICLDFASPAAFTTLDSRPSLILAPARTWDTNVGLAMWEQAKTRASEVGSMVLWCDGGVTGVSGVGGGGIHEPMQIGAGSWLRRIAVPYPFSEDRTVYAKAGEFSVIVFLVALMGGGVATNALLMQSSHGVIRLLMGGRAVLREIPSLRRMLSPPRTEVDLLGAEEVGERQSLLG